MISAKVQRVPARQHCRVREKSLILAKTANRLKGDAIENGTIRIDRGRHHGNPMAAASQMTSQRQKWEAIPVRAGAEDQAMHARKISRILMPSARSVVPRSAVPREMSSMWTSTVAEDRTTPESRSSPANAQNADRRGEGRKSAERPTPS